MSYTITLTDGSIFATIADGTINTTSSMTLVGKNYAGYGQFLDTNFIRLLENSSNSTAPGAPITGQLWWNNTPNAGVLSLYMGTDWKTLSAMEVGATTPSSSIYSTTGDLWYDTTNQQVNIWTGTAWLLVGPQFTAGTGVTGAFANVITDTNTLTHKVIELVVNSAVVGIISEDVAFTPQSTILGFSNVNPGLQLANIVSGVGGTSIPAFWGTGSSGVSVTGNIAGNVFIGNGSQLTGIAAYTNANVVTFLGSGNSLVMSTTGNINTTANVSVGSRVSATGNVTGGNIVTAGNVTATGNVTGSYLLGNGSFISGVTFYSNSSVAAYLPVYTGDLQVGNITNSLGNAVGNVGNATGFFNSIFANTYVGGTVKTGVYVTGNIPAAAAAGEGSRAFVSDATATTFASAYTGGGANKVPVYSDGSAWYIG
jgi:hypothetical protein